MSELPDESIQCCVTSPPYWGLRKYKGNQDSIWGGREDCQHEWDTDDSKSRAEKTWDSKSISGNVNEQINNQSNKPYCSVCGAWRGAYGLEPTPELYVNHTVEIFREVRRVLRSDGVCFLNCGDSYFASGGAHKPEHANPGLSNSARRGGVPHEEQNGKRDKVLSNLKPYGFVSESPCDECVKIRSLRTSDNHDYHVQESHLSNVESSHSYKVSMLAHQDNSHLASPDVHNEAGILGLDCVPNLIDGQPHAVQESTNLESSEQLQGACSQKADWFSSPDVLSVLSHVFQECVYRKVCPFFAQTFAGVSLDFFESLRNTHGIEEIDDSLAFRKSDKACDSSVSAYPYYTIQPHLKAKDLCLIPQHLAIALQRDGWWVRSVIIWSKNNPMPESVRDRPTESHEYILLLTKSNRYFWDMEAVREKYTEPLNRWGGNDVRNSSHKYIDTFENGEDNGGIGAIVKTSMLRAGGLTRPDENGRNLRSVWTFSTQPYSDWGYDYEAADYVGEDGKPYKVSPDCPIHGQHHEKETQKTASCDGQLNQSQNDISGNANGHALTPESESVSTHFPGVVKRAGENYDEQIPENNGENKTCGLTPVENQTSGHIEHTQKIPVSSSDYSCQQSAQIATLRSKKTRKTAPVPVTNPSYNASVENASRKHDKPTQLSMVDSAERTSENNNEVGHVSNGKVTNPLAGTLFHNARNSYSNYTCKCRVSQMSHFATFPEELPERCIKAGTPEYGCCDKCGTPYERIVKATGGSIGKGSWVDHTSDDTLGKTRSTGADHSGTAFEDYKRETLGWQQVCKCPDSKPVPSLVLDPFTGSGTTLWVAKKLGRKAVGYELSEQYCELAVNRNCQQALV